jgi:hypothetical protein
MSTINVTDAMTSRALVNLQDTLPSTEKKREAVKGFALPPAIADGQILKNLDVLTLSAVSLGNAIDAYQPSESDWQDFTAALARREEIPREPVFDPGAWEKHANVLVAAIIALNVARVTNSELRGHFSIMAADAAKSQGAAIVESGKAALFSAITAAVVSGAIAGFAMVKTFQGQALRHTDISLHKRNSLDANIIERDLKRDRAADSWDPGTTHKIQVFDDFGRSKTVDFKSKGSTLTPDEQAWFDKEILKAQNVAQTSDWLSQTGMKGIEKKLEIGRALNAMSMSVSQVVSSLVRTKEFAAREAEVLQQSAQNTQKSLADEIGQKDSGEAALLQKLMDVVMQLFQSRIEVIGALTRG